MAGSEENRYDADELPQELVTALRDAYQPAGIVLTGPARREHESEEYGACRLSLAQRSVVFRVAKTTPTKLGQFVTLWKRPAPGADIAPLDSSDGIDFVVVSVADRTRSGQFIFDRAALLKQGVMSLDGRGGKRAMRVYPPWSTPVSRDAVRTQQWQLRYFVALGPSEGYPAGQLRALFHLDSPG